MHVSSSVRRLRRWITAGAALSVPLALALSASAQTLTPQPCPTPAPETTAPVTEPVTQTITEAPQNVPQNPPQNAAQNPSPERGAAIGNETVAQAIIVGGGLSATTGVLGAPGFTASPQPLILPGLFTATVAEGARPTDRVFSDYGYYSGVRTLSPSGSGQIVPGFNLNYWDFGVEKTFCDGHASVLVHVPVLDATDNSTGVPLDGFGDITAGLKVALWENCDTGSAFSAGLLVATPTGRDEHFTTTTSAGGTTTTTLNPTFLTPFLAGLAVCDGWYVQDYCSAVIPLESGLPVFINNDTTFGFCLYRAACADRLLSWIAPTIDVQTIIPLDHAGLPAATASATMPVPGAIVSGEFGFSDQVFLTEGLQVGICSRATLSAGVVEPLMGPRSFSIGVVTGFNLFF